MFPPLYANICLGTTASHNWNSSEYNQWASRVDSQHGTQNKTAFTKSSDYIRVWARKQRSNPCHDKTKADRKNQETSYPVLFDPVFQVVKKTPNTNRNSTEAIKKYI